MDRRAFLHLTAASSCAFAADAPRYRVVSTHRPAGGGMPGPFPGRLSTVHHAGSVDPESEKIDRAAVSQMMRAGLPALTGDKDPRDAWARFFTPEDVVGIKINASGAPQIHSAAEVVGEIALNLTAIGVKPENIWVHERFAEQVDRVPFAAFLPDRVHIVTADRDFGYDPYTYVDVNFFGEDDTRSNMTRIVTDTVTKIINVPNVKDHGASGVTGCLKNIAYGEFGNVARSHYAADTHTLTFIGTLAAVEPLRSKTVLHVMDGLKGVWHGGPFSYSKKFRFYPGRLLFGTDPVAIDRILLDIIEEKRRAENALSVWSRSRESIDPTGKQFREDPNFNRYLREPGHIEYAASLGLGVYDKSKIDIREVKL